MHTTQTYPRIKPMTQKRLQRSLLWESGDAERPDLDPQDGAIWPLGQVHMLGLEQKPSPHELRQIAAKGT